MIVKTHFKDKSILAMTVFPFILISKTLYDIKLNNISLDIIINHERIHLKQQLEMLVIPFYIWYFIEYLIRYYQYRNWYKAYQNISFEREAYKHERDLNYIIDRKSYSWFKYLKFKNYNKY